MLGNHGLGFLPENSTASTSLSTCKSCYGCQFFKQKLTRRPKISITRLPQTKYNLVLFEQVSGEEWGEKKKSDVQNEV